MMQIPRVTILCMIFLKDLFMADGEYIEVDDDPQRNAGVLRPNEVSLCLCW